MIYIIPNGPMLYIISQLKENDLSHIAQVSRRFNILIEQHRELRYAGENFNTLLNISAYPPAFFRCYHLPGTAADISGILWLARHHPERKCSLDVLNWASKNGHTEIVRLLLKANKPCTERALNSASLYGYTEIVKLLLAANKDCTERALNWASKNGHTGVVKLLLAENKPCTKFALNWASYHGHIEIVRLLIAENKPYSVAALDYAS